MFSVVSGIFVVVFVAVFSQRSTETGVFPAEVVSGRASRANG